MLLCDEATSALDPSTTLSILNLIKDINRKLGITVVIITHQMSVVEQVCNRVAILDAGTVVEEGEVAAIFSNPNSEAAKRLVYPGGAPRQELLVGHRCVRVAFGGTQTTDKPLVASLAIECGALVSILAADTRIVNGQTLGSMLLALPDMPLRTWETFYATVGSTLLALVIGLPLGVLLVVGEPGGVLPLPRWLLRVLNAFINLLRSVPFLILMIAVIPLSRFVVGTSIGTVASIVPLTVASFPFIARLVESSLREMDPGVIEAAQSMGAAPFQIISKVLLPESKPSLISNLTIALTTVPGYSAMAGIIGGGLGKVAIDYGYYRYKELTMVVFTAMLVVLVQVFQAAGTWLVQKNDKRLKK